MESNTIKLINDIETNNNEYKEEIKHESKYNETNIIINIIQYLQTIKQKIYNGFLDKCAVFFGLLLFFMIIFFLLYGIGKEIYDADD